jgi:Protein N-terminal asparagine amidohydrolase
MRLGNQIFTTAKPTNAGREMYGTLMGTATPVPAKYMHVTAPSVPLQAIVPLAQAADFHPAAGAAWPVPNQEGPFLAARRTFQDRVDREAICVHQRGYAITDSSSKLPLLATLSIAPCIVVVVHNPNTKTAALTHVDANMNTASIANVVNEFAPGAPLDLFFHGGMSGVAESQSTCEGLLQGLYQLEAGQDRFTLLAFDVLDRPHGREVTFDPATATVHPGFAPPTMRLDSTFRMLRDGTYLVGDAVMMADRCEQIATSADAAVAAAGVAARDIRKQFDGRPDKINSFLKTVEAAIFSTIGATVVQRAGRGSAELVTKAVSSVLSREKVLETVEQNLKTYLAVGPSRAGDTSYLVEALIIALINEEDLTDATRGWLARTRR